MILLLFFFGVADQHRVFIVVEQDTASIAFHIFVLPFFHIPNEDGDEDQTEEHHAGDHAVDDFHLYYSLNKLRMRAAFPITSSELSGMVMAATRGVT